MTERLGAAADLAARGPSGADSAEPLVALLARDGHTPQLLQALPAAIYTTDREGRITFFNKAAAEFAGRRPVLGHDQWCISWRLYRADGSPLPHEECPMAVALKTGKPVRGVELIMERPDGQRCPILVYPTPLHDEDGRLVGAINMLVDISERRNAESRQRILVRELNHRVKNNMQMVYALLDLAMRDSRNDEARGVLSDTNRRVGAMATAQRALYEAGDGTVEAQNVLLPVCQDARHGFASNGSSPQIDIELTCARGRLSNDTAMPLALILSELLANSVKHGIRDRPSGAIKVALIKDADGFQLTVEDDGPGFNSDKSHSHSSGLGLVFGLARQLGGGVTVTRTPGARCTVRFIDRHAP